MAARQGTPGLGVLAETTCGRAERTHPKKWTVRGLSLPAVVPPLHRHRRADPAGGQPQPDREHLSPGGLQRRAPFTSRWSVVASVPCCSRIANSSMRPPASTSSTRSATRASDSGRGFSNRPRIGRQHLRGDESENSTGVYNATGAAVSGGKTIIATADQSIQAGDGGTGFSIDIQAFKRVKYRNELYFAGVYLFNPRDTNGVSTFRRANGRRSCPCTDQYLFRGGIGRSLPKIRALAASSSAASKAFRCATLSGATAPPSRLRNSVDPGLMYARSTYMSH